MSTLDIVDHASYVEVRDVPYHPCIWDDLYCLDLFIPKGLSHISSDCILNGTVVSLQHHKLQERKSKVTFDTTEDSTQFLSPVRKQCSTPPPPPVVVFVHGGGWQRGGRKAWIQYAQTLNLLLSAITWSMGLYNNVGRAFASRGVACAVISYPLTRLPMPWSLLDITVSYVCGVVFTLIVYFLLSVVNGVVLYILYISWNDSTYLPVYRAIPFGSSFKIIPNVLTLLTFNNILTFSAIIIFSSRKHFRHLPFKPYVVLVGITFAFHVLSSTECHSCVYIATLVPCIGLRLVSHSQSESVSYVHQLTAVSNAVRWIIQYGEMTGHLDHESLFLMGHSAGGHLVSLVTVDEDHLVQAGCSPRVIKGVICISGVYDLLKLSAPITRYLYLHPTFGSHSLTWEQASPLLALLNASERSSYPPFLILNAEYDGHLNREAEEFLTQLKRRNIDVTRVVVPRTMHFTIMSSFSVSLDSSISRLCVEFILTSIP